MVREQAVATGGMWAGLVRTERGLVSGWHHHAAYETAIYVMTGALRMEFGPGGRDVLEADPGDFLYVAPGPSIARATRATRSRGLIVVRSGSGDTVVNVGGPDPGR